MPSTSSAAPRPRYPPPVSPSTDPIDRTFAVSCGLGFSGIPDLIASGCWVGAVEPGEHGRRDDDGREGRPRACHSHQRPREDSRLYAR